MPLPWTTRSVTGADGLALAVHETGAATSEAPVVLLVHGFPDDHAVWDLVAAELAPDHHVVAHDVRGAGASGVPASRAGYRMAALIEDLEAVAEAVAPGRQVHLVAHDWGSIQSWAAVLHPTARQRFGSFLSMSGPPLQHVAGWREARSAEGPSGWSAMASQAVKSAYIPAFLSPLGPAGWRRLAGPRWRQRMVRAGVPVDDRFPSADVVAQGVRGMELYRANIGLGRPKPLPPIDPPTTVPVHLLVATDDPHVTPKLLDGLDALATTFERSRLTGGHWLPRTRPADVAATVRRHVAAHPVD